MERELKSLGKVLENPEKPCVYILGGAKGDDSLKISKYVLDNSIADYVLTGGVTGQLFRVAKGSDLGKANMKFLGEKEVMQFLPGIKELIAKYPEKIKAPLDFAVEVNGKRREVSINEMPTDYLIFDIGAKTVEEYEKIIVKAKAIVISGPVGMFENKEFAFGTKKILEEIIMSKAFSLAGGGHTIAAIDELGLVKRFRTSAPLAEHSSNSLWAKNCLES